MTTHTISPLRLRMIENMKGRKDRHVMVPKGLLALLGQW